MTKDEQIKMLKEQRAVLRASNEKFRKEFIDKACRWLVEHSHNSDTQDGITCTPVMTEGTLIEDFRKAMTAKTNPLFEKCLANVNPETRAEVRKNMDLANLLTWEDVRSIVEIADEMIRTAHNRVKWEDSSPEAYYKEVLTKFNEKKYGKGI